MPKVKPLVLTLDTFKGHDIYIYGEFFCAISADRKWYFDHGGIGQVNFKGQKVKPVKYSVDDALANYAKQMCELWVSECCSDEDDPEWFLSCWAPFIVSAVKYGCPKPTTENDLVVWPFAATGRGE